MQSRADQEEARPRYVCGAPKPLARSSRRTSCAHRIPGAARPATARGRIRGSQKPPCPAPSGARCDAMPVSSCRRTPASVASSGSTAWVAALVHVTCGGEGGDQVAAPPERPPPPTRSAPPSRRSARRAWVIDGVEARELAGRISRRNARRRWSAPGASSWSARTGVIAERDLARVRVEHIKQRQVARRDRLPQPLLAERPRAEALDVGHVGVQDDAERVRAEDGEQVEAASRSARRSVKSRALIAGVKRS